MKCQHCGKDYEPLRATSKFCSPSCRVLHNRDSEQTSYAGPPQQLKDHQSEVVEALQERFASKPEPMEGGATHVHGPTSDDLGGGRSTRKPPPPSGPLLWPLGMDKDTVMARLARIRSYNLWASRQLNKIPTYSRNELGSILQRSGYDPQLSRLAFD